MRVIYALAFCLTLSGCMSTQTNTKAARDYQAKQQTAIEKAKMLARESDYHNKIAAIEQFILADKLAIAQELYKEMSSLPLPANDRAYYQLVGAELHLAQREPRLAAEKIAVIRTTLPPHLQLRAHELRARIYQRLGNLQDAIQERIYLGHHLEDAPSIASNNQEIWEILTSLTPAALEKMRELDDFDSLSGWLEFAYIAKHYELPAYAKLRMLENWRKKYPDHPAETISTAAKEEQDSLLNSLHNSTTVAIPRHIALILPLTGKQHSKASALRNGFLSAYYSHKDSGTKPKVSIIDSSQSGVEQAYNNAIDKGADFVVGPLLKEEVEQLSKMPELSVPVLSMNYYSGRRPHPNLFQFGLKPESEAVDVANRAWSLGHRRALVLCTKSTLSQRIAKSFADSWQAMGGEIVQIREISEKDSKSTAVAEALELDHSKNRAAELKKLGLNISSIPRRRQDINMVFLATNAATARQLKPLLNFHYAANLPVYATSNVYSGKPDASMDQDLNSIQFCDMPWVLDKDLNRKLSSHARELSSDEQRLFALGLDAYKLSMQLGQLRSFPTMGISGVTGMLKLEEEQKIHRKLIWAQFKQGIPTIYGEQL